MGDPILAGLAAALAVVDVMVEDMRELLERDGGSWARQYDWWMDLLAVQRALSSLVAMQRTDRLRGSSGS